MIDNVFFCKFVLLTLFLSLKYIYMCVYNIIIPFLSDFVIYGAFVTCGQLQTSNMAACNIVNQCLFTSSKIHCYATIPAAPLSKHILELPA